MAVCRPMQHDEQGSAGTHEEAGIVHDRADNGRAESARLTRPRWGVVSWLPTNRVWWGHSFPMSVTRTRSSTSVTCPG